MEAIISTTIADQDRKLDSLYRIRCLKRLQGRNLSINCPIVYDKRISQQKLVQNFSHYRPAVKQIHPEMGGRLMSAHRYLDRLSLR